MKTKITAILLAAAILFSFAACGKTEADTTTSAATTVQTTIQTGGTTAAETTTVTENTQTQTDSRTGADTTATATTTVPATTAPVVKTFTAAQLAEFNGKNGKDAYIAYKGIVYDVTSKLKTTWKNGEHNGLMAGMDLTAQFESCNKHTKAFIAAQISTYPEVGTYTG